MSVFVEGVEQLSGLPRYVCFECFEEFPQMQAVQVHLSRQHGGGLHLSPTFMRQSLINLNAFISSTCSDVVPFTPLSNFNNPHRISELHTFQLNNVNTRG